MRPNVKRGLDSWTGFAHLISNFVKYLIHCSDHKAHTILFHVVHKLDGPVFLLRGAC